MPGGHASSTSPVLVGEVRIEMDSENGGTTTPLTELPAEMILEILQHLTAIRGHFVEPEREDARRADNARRLTALHGLALSCRLLNSLATPYLYESITDLGAKADWEDRLCLLRTLTEKPAMLDYIRYIETGDKKIRAPLGRLIENCAGEYRDRHRDRVHDLIQRARNLECVAFHCNWNMTYRFDPSAHPALRHVFFKRPDVKVVEIRGSPTSQFNLALILRNELPALYPRHPRPTPPLPDVFIERISIEAKNLSLDRIARYLWDFSYLRQFSFRLDTVQHPNTMLANHWPRIPEPPIDFPLLLRYLSRFEAMLESLTIDTLCVAWDVDGDNGVISAMGSLRKFTQLKHIDVSGMVLWGDDVLEDVPQLSAILPEALEDLTIHVAWDEFVEDALAELAVDCPTHFPKLKKIDCSWQPAAMVVGNGLIDKFRAIGVELKLDVPSDAEAEEKRYKHALMEQAMDSTKEDLIRYEKEMERIEWELRGEEYPWLNSRQVNGQSPVTSRRNIRIH